MLRRLLELSADKSEEMRVSAADAVGRLGASAATPDVLRRLVELSADKSDYVRGRAADALGRLGASAASPGVVRRLLELSEDKSEDVRGRAADALGRLATPVHDDALIQALAKVWTGRLKETRYQFFADGHQRTCDKAFSELRKLAAARAVPRAGQKGP